MVESLSSCYVVYEECSDGTPVVRSSDRTEVLLACSVPNLKLNVFVANFDGFCSEFNSDGYVVGCASLVFDELQHNTGLTNTSVSDNDEFEQVMVRIH